MSQLARLAFRFHKFHRFPMKISPWFHGSNFSTSSTDSPSCHPLPPPIRIGITESAGRGVFPLGRIGAGELIHTAEPVVSHPSLSLLHEVCYFCLRKLSKVDAGLEAPRTVSFCSEQCEKRSKNFYEVEKKADWSRFYEYCRMQGLKYPLLVKRLASQVISGAVSPGVLDILQPELLSTEKISAMKREVGLLRSIFEDTDIERERMFLLKSGILVFWHEFASMPFVLNFLKDRMKIFFSQQLHR